MVHYSTEQLSSAYTAALAAAQLKSSHRKNAESWLLYVVSAYVALQRLATAAFKHSLSEFVDNKVMQAWLDKECSQ